MTKPNQTEIDLVNARWIYLEAFREGKEVQFMDHSGPPWTQVDRPERMLWRNLELRIAPEPVRVLFGPTDVWGKVFRKIGAFRSSAPQLVDLTTFLLTGIGWVQYDELALYEHSTDGGLTWKPCYKEEER